MDEQTLKRLIKEHSDLEKSEKKLNAFIATKRFSELDAENQSLLMLQEHVTLTLLQILWRRIEINKKDNNII